jgi:NADH-quinone oxidoreductase subunit L
VLAENFLLMFVGWEGVGLASYLLIGFYFTRDSAANAGKKAFIVNRIGDFGFLIAMFLLVAHFGSLSFSDVFSQIGAHPEWQSGFLTAIALFLVLGATGKSAQIPLYVWLPDAMAGPTPVSALIHAATMVTAGIYLICRLSFVFVLSPFTMMLIACVGAGTALFAATIAVVQNDIKKVLAYSTVSQLGFMFLGVGVGAFTSGFFHVFTHAFFKACLFLGAGSVIHAMHSRIHDGDSSQDIRNMGGLRKWMPLTHWTFAAATAAIIGLPLTSGFFSKDEILYRSFVARMVNPHEADSYVPPAWLGTALYAVAVLAAILTAFYMCRLYFLTFWGDFRGWTVGRPSLLAKQELAAHEAHGDDDEHGHHHEDLSTPGYPPHESPWQMTVPLIILATFSVFAGFLNPGFGLKFQPMEHWLEPVFKEATEGAVLFANGHDAAWADHMTAPLAVGGFLAFAIGSGLAYWMYIVRAGAPAKQLAAAQPGLYRLLLDKWRIDELYDATIVAAVDSLAETSAAVDKTLVDGIIARLTSLIVAALGTILRAFQNGVVHVYAAMMVVGLAVTGWFFAVPHANVTVVDAGNDDYVLTAAPGVGYAYRWDANNDGKPEKPDFDGTQTLKVHVEPGKSQTVLLEVKNAFGLEGHKRIPVARPTEPTSSL